MSGKEKDIQKISTNDQLTRRFYILNTCVTILLVAAIIISINQFGGEAWHGRRQIALVLPGEKNNVGWDRSQYLAMKNVCEEFDYELVVRENIPMDYESCAAVAEELSKRGVSNICFANGCKIPDMRSLEKKYPLISFSTIEIVSAVGDFGRCAILSFEGAYLSGILAGLRTHTNKVGYIAPYSDSEVNQGINAFALGVQRVNPNAEILLNWTNTWDNASKEEQAVQNLKAERVDVLTYHENSDTIPNAAKSAGIYFISYNEAYPENNYCLGFLRIDWKTIYKDLLKYKTSRDPHSRYSLGLASNIIRFDVSDIVTKRERIAIETAKWKLKNRQLIFQGDIVDRSGVKKCSANESISLQSLMENTNWLIKGVKIVGN